MRTRQRTPGGRPNPYGNIYGPGGYGGGGFDWNRYRKYLPYIIAGIVAIVVIWMILTQNIFVVIGGTLIVLAMAIGLGFVSAFVFGFLFPFAAQAIGLRVRR